MHGYDASSDNVKRRAAYLAWHPSVTIRHVTQPHWEWIAQWTDQGNRCTLRDSELGNLLDELDNLDLGTNPSSGVDISEDTAEEDSP